MTIEGERPAGLDEWAEMQPPPGQATPLDKGAPRRNIPQVADEMQAALDEGAPLPERIGPWKRETTLGGEAKIPQTILQMSDDVQRVMNVSTLR